MGEEEEGKGAGPLRPEYVRLIKIGIVAVIVIVAVVSAIPFIQQAIAQPRISITDSNFGSVGCGLFGTSQTVVYSFTLINTGDADGFVQIGFFIDGNLATQNTFFVGQGLSIPKVENVQLGDCGTHTPGLRILGVSKA